MSVFVFQALRIRPGWLPILLAVLSFSASAENLPEEPASPTWRIYFAYARGQVSEELISGADWQPVRSTVLPTFTEKTLWIKMQFRNPGKENLVLEYTDPRVDVLHCYLRKEGRFIYQGSAGETLKGRYLSLRPGLLLDTSDQESGELFVAVYNPFNANTGLALFEKTDYMNHSRVRSLLQSSFLGLILVTIVFYSLSLASRNRPMVAGYVLYLTGLAMYLAYRTGLYQMLPVKGAVTASLPAPFFALMYSGGLHFFRHFLELPLRSALGGFVCFLQWAMLLLFPLYLFSPEWTFAAGMYLSYIVPPIILLISVYFAFQNLAARVFALLWSLPIVFAVLETLSRSGLIQAFFPEDFLIQSGLLFQILGFSAFLGLKIRKEERERVEQEARLLIVQNDLTRARELLTANLPNSLELPGFRIYAHYSPSSEMGGDYYDLVIRSDGSAGILVADVSGHGLPAALEASTVHVAHRSTRNLSGTAGQALREMARYLDPMQSYRFLSAIYAVIDPRNGRLEISRAGHPPALILRANGSVDTVGPLAPLLGLIPEHPYGEELDTLMIGDRLLLYTDGVYEIADEEQNRPPELSQVVQKYSGLKGEPFVSAICSEYERLRPPQNQDDVTFLEIERLR
ncbi:MAG: SpoIIE family protein phosphatase [Leptospiraceae bacterium]|nr:SpoIIE family protein phosphatase [Leptospiraceae bacterium]